MQPRDVANGGDLVIAKVQRRHFAVGKEQFLSQCVTDALHNAAVDLAVVQQRIENFAGMMNGDEATQLDLAAWPSQSRCMKPISSLTGAAPCKIDRKKTDVSNSTSKKLDK
jgi:hypothetical protein